MYGKVQMYCWKAGNQDYLKIKLRKTKTKYDSIIEIPFYKMLPY
jgi:hypothetical protein